MAKVLIVDDDQEIREIVRECLIRDGHIVYSAMDAEEAMKQLEYMPDIILLDVMMPGKSGLALCRELRPKVDIPILFLTARTSSQDLVEGLAVGADEYIKKPFSIAELRARVNAHIRRETRGKHQRFVLHPFIFDLAAFELFYHETPIPLTNTEYHIAEYLALHHGQVFSKHQIFDAIWGQSAEGNVNTVVEHIRNLRKKIQDIANYDPIHTIWGVGYSWKKNSEN